MKKPTFEEAFERLEKILELMNEGKVTLEESMALFEEGDALIKLCDQYLSSAQKKIETLIKDREGSLIFDQNQMPQREPFSPSPIASFDSNN